MDHLSNDDVVNPFFDGEEEQSYRATGSTAISLSASGDTEETSSFMPDLSEDEFALPDVPPVTVSSGDPKKRIMEQAREQEMALPVLEEEVESLPTSFQEKALPVAEEPQQQEQESSFSLPRHEEREEMVAAMAAPEEAAGVEEGDNAPEMDAPLSVLESIFGDGAGDDDDDYDHDGEEDERDDIESFFVGSDEEEEEDLLHGFDIDAVIAAAIDAGASDVHINADDKIAFTYLGEIVRQPQYQVPTGNLMLRLQQTIISHVLEATFVEELELDTSYVVKTGRHQGRRTRLNVGKSFGDIMMTFRVIADQVPTPDELRVPKEVQGWFDAPNGMVLINGKTGSGKSTTIASLLRRVQLARPQKIVTLEKPVEFIFGNDGKALVVQREVGRDCRTFAAGIKSAMRQAPDIIVVGEVRDREEVGQLMVASETGHLAVSTIHAISAEKTLTRIKELYEGDEQSHVLGNLADMSRGWANQILVKTTDGTSRFATHEVLTFTEEVREMVAAGDTRAIRKYQNEREATMEHALARAVQQGLCTWEEARYRSGYQDLFDKLTRRTR